MKFCRQTGKMSHASRGKAEAALRGLNKIKPAYKGNIYPCIHCRGFHVGRARQGAHRNKYR